RFPGLAVVGEMRADYSLEVHPEVTVVKFVHVARGRGARHDGAAAFCYVDTCAERLATRMFEDDVGILAPGELTDLGAESLPFARILGVGVFPEFVTLGGPIDDQLGTHLAAQFSLLWARDHA